MVAAVAYRRISAERAGRRRSQSVRAITVRAGGGGGRRRARHRCARPGAMPWHPPARAHAATNGDAANARLHLAAKAAVAARGGTAAAARRPSPPTSRDNSTFVLERLGGAPTAAAARQAPSFTLAPRNRSPWSPRVHARRTLCEEAAAALLARAVAACRSRRRRSNSFSRLPGPPSCSRLLARSSGRRAIGSTRLLRRPPPRAWRRRRLRQRRAFERRVCSLARREMSHHRTRRSGCFIWASKGASVAERSGASSPDAAR